MKNYKNAIRKITLAVEGIDKAILVGDQEVFDVTTIEQLERFKVCLLRVLKLVSLDDIPEKNNRELGLARVIVDQWPFDLELGLLIVEAEQAYKTL
jgi:phosphoribosylformimino-5-aminoimidazole carboxamide ribonucleotide (ProFAR) isomerase